VTERITSAANQKVKDWARLARENSLRRERGLFLTEGDKLTEQAFLSGCKCRVLMSADGAFPEGFDAAEKIQLSEACIKKITLMNCPPRIMGIFELPCTDRTRFEKPGRFLALDGLQDPGNVGTILRTALAFGVDGVVTDSAGNDLFGPKALRSSMGAGLALPIWQTEDLPSALKQMQKAGSKVFATALREDAVLLPQVEVPDSFVLVIGNEGHGISNEVLALADQTVLIPMNGKIQSLNAATAAAISLYEFFQRKAAMQV